jgi:hypothetical protein
MPKRLAAHGASGGTTRPRAALRCWLPADLDARLREFCNARDLGLGQTVGWAIAAYLDRASGWLGYTQHPSSEDSRE